MFIKDARAVVLIFGPAHRYPKYGPETEARGAGREGAEHLWQAPYYPSKDHELETDIRSG